VCTSLCSLGRERNYRIITPAVAKGKACRGATDCKPGEGACPVTTSTTTTTIPEGKERATTTSTTVSTTEPAAAATAKRGGSRAGIAVVVTLLLLAIVVAAVWSIRRDPVDANPIGDYMGRSMNNVLYGSAADVANDGQERATGTVQLTPNVIYDPYVSTDDNAGNQGSNNMVVVRNNQQHFVVPMDGAPAHGAGYKSTTARTVVNALYGDGDHYTVPLDTSTTNRTMDHTTEGGVDLDTYGQISSFSGEEKAKLTNIHNVADDMYEAGSANSPIVSANNTVYAVPTEDGEVVYGSSSGNVVNLQWHGSRVRLNTEC